MEFLLVGSYWFANGVFFVLVTRKIIKTRSSSLGWFLALCLAIFVGVLLLFGATLCLDHFLEALLFEQGFLLFC